jgi:hypothetical protein
LERETFSSLDMFSLVDMDLANWGWRVLGRK